MSDGWGKYKYVVQFCSRSDPANVLEYWAGTDYDEAVAKGIAHLDREPDSDVTVVEIAEHVVWRGVHT